MVSRTLSTRRVMGCTLASSVTAGISEAARWMAGAFLRSRIN